MWQQVELALSQSAHRVLVKLAIFLPALVALLLAVIILTAIGAGLAALVRRFLTAAKFDERLARNSIAPISDWSLANSPTALIARVVFWGCVLLGCFIGISAADAAYPGELQISSYIIPYITHSVGAVLLFIAGTVIARFLERSVLIGAVNAKLQYARFLSLGIKWLVLVLTAAMMLDHLQVGGSVVALAFGILFGEHHLRPHPRRSRLQGPNTHGNPAPLLESLNYRKGIKFVILTLSEVEWGRTLHFVRCATISTISNNLRRRSHLLRLHPRRQKSIEPPPRETNQRNDVPPR